MTAIVREVSGEKPSWEVGVLTADEFGDMDGTVWLTTVDSKKEVADYVHWLNGGQSSMECERIARVWESVAERLDRIWRTLGRCR